MTKSSIGQIRERFDREVERFANLETGQSATMDAPLTLALIADAAARVTPGASSLLDVGCGIGLRQIGDFAIAGMQLGDILELQFLDDIADPALAKGFPGNRGHRSRAKQRPQRHLNRAGRCWTAPSSA